MKSYIFKEGESLYENIAFCIIGKYAYNTEVSEEYARRKKERCTK